MAKAKRSPLVSQFLEGISIAALEEYQDLFREYARRRHGVYALYKGKRLYYVGLARDLRGRLKQHLKDRHGKLWDRFSMYLTLNDSHIRELESLVLRIVRPTGNRQIGKFGRAENLRRAFARKVREDSRRRLNDLLGHTRLSKARLAKVKSDKKVGVLAAYLSKPTRLRGRYKGKIIRARVLKNGLISIRGKQFRSPSLAARAAKQVNRAVNGWSFWTYERAPGDWVSINELRR